MEVCTEADLIALEDSATVCDRAFQISKSLEVPVRERLIEDGPEMLGGLKLRRVAGQIDETDPIRHNQVWRRVPAGIVKAKRDDALASCPGLTRKERQQRGKERLGDTVRHVPESLTRGRLDEGRDVEPLIAVVAKRDRALALGRPHSAQDRLQADAVLVRGPDLNRFVRVLGRFLGNNRGQLF
jgi:hypothetical protein